MAGPLTLSNPDVVQLQSRDEVLSRVGAVVGRTGSTCPAQPVGELVEDPELRFKQSYMCERATVVACVQVLK